MERLINTYRIIVSLLSVAALLIMATLPGNVMLLRPLFAGLLAGGANTLLLALSCRRCLALPANDAIVLIRRSFVIRLLLIIMAGTAALSQERSLLSALLFIFSLQAAYLPALIFGMGRERIGFMGGENDGNI